MAQLQKITTNLWFDDQAENAAKFYTSIFKNSSIGKISRYSKEGFEHHHRPAGSAMVVEFYLEGQQFLALNGGPIFKFSEAISLVVNCDNQEEIDYYWEKLTQEGDPKAQMCGWLKDKYGLSWQIVPAKLSEWAVDADVAKSDRVMREMLRMKKMDMNKLEQAYLGKL